MVSKNSNCSTIFFEFLIFFHYSFATACICRAEGDNDTRTLQCNFLSHRWQPRSNQRTLLHEWNIQQILFEYVKHYICWPTEYNFSNIYLVRVDTMFWISIKGVKFHWSWFLLWYLRYRFSDFLHFYYTIDRIAIRIRIINGMYTRPQDRSLSG